MRTTLWVLVLMALHVCRVAQLSKLEGAGSVFVGSVLVVALALSVRADWRDGKVRK